MTKTTTLGKPPSLFKKASDTDKKVKIMAYGDAGTAKTTTALQASKHLKTAVIDMERGTHQYSGDFDFDRIDTTSAEGVEAAIASLEAGGHGYELLIIDPITIFWEALQKKWSDIFLNRKKTGNGFKFEFYEFQVNDWSTIKADLKQFIRRLTALDMHVWVICRAKKQMEKRNGEFVPVGEAFDGERSFPFVFDTILHHRRDKDGGFWVRVEKDRGNRMEGNFQFQTANPGETFDKIDSAYGITKGKVANANG